MAHRGPGVERAERAEVGDLEAEVARLRAEKAELERQVEATRFTGAPADVRVPDVLPLAPARQVLRLDLGCGETPRDGFEGVDAYAPSARHRVDLLRFPWPWADSSVEEIHSSHFVEHIPQVYVSPDNARELVQRPGIVDLFVAFFNECWRVLRPGASMLVVTPALQSVRAFQDPTHRRYLPREAFNYLNADFRRQNKLDHYLGATCDFVFPQGGSVPIVPTELTLLSPEAQNRRFVESWNTVVDWHTILICRKAEGGGGDGEAR